MLVWFLLNTQNKPERWHKLTATLRPSQVLEGACFHGGVHGGFCGGFLGGFFGGFFGGFSADFSADISADFSADFRRILRRPFSVDFPNPVKQSTREIFSPKSPRKSPHKFSLVVVHSCSVGAQV